MEAATVYSYTPAQNRVIDLYNDYRTALMNAKYYSQKLNQLKNFNFAADLVVAITSSAAFAGLAIWKAGIGANVFSVALGIAALVSATRPILRLSDKIDRYSKLHYSYLEVFYKIDSLISEMKSSPKILDEHIRKASELTERFRAVELEGDAYQSPKRLLKLQDEIEATLPAAQMWLPSE